MSLHILNLIPLSPFSCQQCSYQICVTSTELRKAAQFGDILIFTVQ